MFNDIIGIKTIEITLARVQKCISKIELQKSFEALTERSNHCIRSKRMYVEQK